MPTGSRLGSKQVRMSCGGESSLLLPPLASPTCLSSSYCQDSRFLTLGSYMHCLPLPANTVMRTLTVSLPVPPPTPSTSLSRARRLILITLTRSCTSRSHRYAVPIPTERLATWRMEATCASRRRAASAYVRCARRAPRSASTRPSPSDPARQARARFLR